jgi:hypothetical protein
MLALCVRCAYRSAPFADNDQNRSQVRVPDATEILTRLIYPTTLITGADLSQEHTAAKFSL